MKLSQEVVVRERIWRRAAVTLLAIVAAQSGLVASAALLLGVAAGGA